MKKNPDKKPNPLFRLQAGPWPEDARYHRHRLFWCMGWMLVAVVGITLLSLYWTMRRFTGLLAALPQAPLVLVLNLLPLLLVVVLLYALTGRGTLSVALPGVLLLALSLVNALKINLRGDPLLFSDLSLAGEAGGIMGRYGVVLSKSQIAGIAATVLGLVLLFLLVGKVRLVGHWRVRAAVALVSLAGLVAMLLLVYPNNTLYKTTYADHGTVSARNASLWYSAHGFTYAFLYSALDEDTVSSLLPTGSTVTTELTDKSVTPEEGDASSVTVEETAQEDTANVNIIAIQLEAYCDVTRYLDCEAIEEVYASLHAIEADAISGNLLVNTNGGGTINTERSFMTGYTTLTDFETETNSYIWYLQSLGYTTEGSHPNTGTFYDRVTVNANLGFQTYFFTENYYEGLVTSGYTRSDAILFDNIISLMEDAEGPYFSLNISLQNHGPYSSDTCTGTQYLTAADCSNTTVRNIVNNYLNLIATTNQALADMVETLDSMDTPVLLVVFGDHMPYWGDYTSMDPYTELGINADTSTDEGFYNYYSTPYFIWANAAAREALGQDCVGDGGDIGSCFLMNKVFALCGWTGDEMMQASNQLLEAGITMVSSAVELYCENGVLVEELSEEGQAALDTFLAFQSQWQSSFCYGDLLE